MSDESLELLRALEAEAKEAADGRYAPHNHRPDKRVKSTLCPGCAAEMASMAMASTGLDAALDEARRAIQRWHVQEMKRYLERVKARA